MENQEYNETQVIELKVLRTRSHVVGISRNVQLSEDVAQAFSTQNARGSLRIVSTREEAMKIGSDRAVKLKSILD